MSDMLNWKFKIVANNCAGALTSVAAAFSNENVNITKVTSDETDLKGETVIWIDFESSVDEKDILVRKIKRLTKVNSISESLVSK